MATFKFKHCGIIYVVNKVNKEPEEVGYDDIVELDKLEFVNPKIINIIIIFSKFYNSDPKLLENHKYCISSLETTNDRTIFYKFIDNLIEPTIYPYKRQDTSEEYYKLRTNIDVKFSPFELLFMEKSGINNLLMKEGLCVLYLAKYLGFYDLSNIIKLMLYYGFTKKPDLLDLFKTYLPEKNHPLLNFC